MKRLPLFSSIDQMSNYLKTSRESGAVFEIPAKKHKYEFVNSVLWGIKFKSLSRKEKYIVYAYLKFFTGYSKGTLKRMAQRWQKGTLVYNPARKKHKFYQKYFAQDIALLINTDIAHECLSAEATIRIMKREYEIFGKSDFAKISDISKSHIYNIRNNNNQYASSGAMHFKTTKAAQNNIGVRKKPEPGGKPGYVRVDTVHQGDYAGNKGVYHINIVDEITQYELIATVEKITERYLKPIMEELLKLFPFKIYEFHADNGSEYVNRYTVELLNKLHIQLTKSRSRHSNDNALVESKNGSIIRKAFGRNYIDRKFAGELNDYNKNYFNIYLNYHRPCAYAENRIDAKGKVRKKYVQWMTPYEKLKSLNNSKQYLKDEFTFKELDKIAYAESDNDFAIKIKKIKKKIFKKIGKDNKERFSKKIIKKKNPLDF